MTYPITPYHIALQPPPTAYYVAFGAHGPRQAVNPPGHSIKILVGTLAACGAAIGIFGLIRRSGECSGILRLRIVRLCFRQWCWWTGSMEDWSCGIDEP